MNSSHCLPPQSILRCACVLLLDKSQANVQLAVGIEGSIAIDLFYHCTVSMTQKLGCATISCCYGNITKKTTINHAVQHATLHTPQLLCQTISLLKGQVISYNLPMCVKPATQAHWFAQGQSQTNSGLRHGQTKYSVFTGK
jgi:hypothetical protein